MRSLLRALGAHRHTVFSSIILEAASVAAPEWPSFVFYGAIMSVVASTVRAQTGVVLEPAAFHTVMIWAPAGLIALSALCGIVPAVKAYRTDVAEYLAPIS